MMKQTIRKTTKVSSLSDFLAKRKKLQKKLAILTAVKTRIEKKAAGKTEKSPSSFIGTNIHNGPPSLIDFIC